MKALSKFSVVALAVAFTLGLAGLIRAATTVDLSRADNFAILAGSTITNTGDSVISGNLGLSPGTSVTGFPPGTVSGTQHIADTGADNAKTDLVTAYNDAAGQTPVSEVPTELGGTTKNAGIYNTASGELGITGTLTLDAEGDASAVFIFKAASTLITAGSSSVSLINGAQPCNVFWQVGSSATLGTNSTFVGNILALTSITLNNGATVEGRVLARNGAVTLDTNNITKATCAGVPAPPDTPVTTPSPAAASTTTTSSGAGSEQLPLINVTKIPNPLALPAGAGPVTYTYRVTNIGDLAMSNVTLKDNKCTPVKFISGDRNKDSLLDLDEIWTYRCTTTVSRTVTNTATARGSANGYNVYDTANATVAVGVSSAPPLIHLVKKPNVFVVPTGGGPVTYTYTVTNPGKVPLSDVSVIDNKCTGLPGRVLGHPGDINKNNLLESNETWTFTCQTNLTQTTTNTGTAEGHANGLTAIDFSLSTVVIGSPKLPNAGIDSGNHNGALWIIVVIIPSGIFIALSSFYLARKKQAI